MKYTILEACEILPDSEKSIRFQIAKLENVTDFTLFTPHEYFHVLAIKGTEGIVVKYAKCCRRTLGDHICGFIEPGSGIMVHIEDCPFLENFRELPDKLIPLRWEEKVHGDFSVDLQIDI